MGATLKFAWDKLSARSLLALLRHIFWHCDFPWKRAYRAYSAAWQLWAETILLVFSSAPTLMTVTLALFADPRREDHYAIKRMVLSLAFSSLCAGMNLQMHDLAFVLWTGSQRSELLHLS